MIPISTSREREREDGCPFFPSCAEVDGSADMSLDLRVSRAEWVRSWTDGLCCSALDSAAAALTLVSDGSTFVGMSFDEDAPSSSSRPAGWAFLSAAGR